MNHHENALFSNNCGKIYRDRIVFSTLDESVATENIKSVSLRKSIGKGNLFFILLPCLLVGISFLMPKEDFIIKMLFIVTGVVFFAATLLNVKKRSFIVVSLKTGKNIKVTPRESYPREAKRFVDEASIVIAKGSLAFYGEKLADTQADEADNVIFAGKL